MQLVDTLPPPEEIARRVKAARAYAGYRNPKALAAAIGEPGLGDGVIRQYEEARRPILKRSQLTAIAYACQLPADWFFVANLGEAVAAGAVTLGVSSPEQRWREATQHARTLSQQAHTPPAPTPEVDPDVQEEAP